MNDQSLPNILTIGGELDGLKTRIYTKTANKYDINQPISFFFLSSSKPFQFHYWNLAKDIISIVFGLNQTTFKFHFVRKLKNQKNPKIIRTQR